MSHFISAEITGLAGSDKTTRISFDRHLTVIYGLNGSGKTSLLKILQSAMKGEAALLENVPFSSAAVEFYVVGEKRSFTRSISRSSPKLEWVMAGDPLPADTGKAYMSSFLPASRLYASGKLIPPSKRLDEKWLDQQFAEQVLERWKTYNSNILIEVRNAQAAGLADILKAVIAGDRSTTAEAAGLELERAFEITTRFLNRQGYKGLLGSLETFQNRYQTDKFLQSVVNDVAAVERKVEIATKPQREMEGLISRLYSGGKKLVFGHDSIGVETQPGTRIGIELLSSGEKHLLILFVECLRIGISSILIDEPELSIHVDWQHELAAAFRTLNPDAQFVLATHSPEVMADVDDAQIFKL